MWTSLKSNGCISSVIQNEQRTLHYQRTSLLTSEYYAIYTVWWINLLIPYLHCTCLRRITAPRPSELIRRAVASFWSASLCCITKDRHLVYFWRIIIIIFLLSSKVSATGDMFDKSIHLSSIGTLHWVVMMLRFLAIMYSHCQMCVECKLYLELNHSIWIYLRKFLIKEIMRMSSTKIPFVAQQSVVNHRLTLKI